MNRTAGSEALRDTHTLCHRHAGLNYYILILFLPTEAVSWTQRQLHLSTFRLHASPVERNMRGGGQHHFPPASIPSIIMVNNEAGYPSLIHHLTVSLKNTALSSHHSVFIVPPQLSGPKLTFFPHMLDECLCILFFKIIYLNESAIKVYIVMCRTYCR